MTEPIDVFDGVFFIGWLWDSTMAAVPTANARPFRPYGTPPPFDMDDYKDSFEIWHAQWDIFLELSTINTALDPADQPRYKANILKSCMSKSTLTALLTSGMSAANLQDPDAIITVDAMLTAIATCGASSCPLVSNGTKKPLTTGYAICARFPASASLDLIVVLLVNPPVFLANSYSAYATTTTDGSCWN